MDAMRQTDHDHAHRDRRRPCRSTHRPTRTPTATVVFETKDLAVYYGDFRAVRDVNLDHPPARDHRLHRAVGLRQVDGAAVLRPDERPHRGRPGRGHGHAITASTCTAPTSTPVEVRRRIGMVFQKPNPFPKSIYDNLAFGPRLNGDQEEVRARRHRRALAAPGRAVGRGEGPAQVVGDGPVGRPAAAAVHRPVRRRRARGDPDGRAVLGARPDRHGAHRGADAGDQDRLHDRHRHPQHAAGGAGQRPHRVLHHRGQPRERPPHRACSSSSTRRAKIFSNPDDDRTEQYVTGRFG